MSDIEENQLGSYNERMLKPPFVCPVCEKKPACITTIGWRSCMDCFWEMKSDKNSVLNST